MFWTARPVAPPLVLLNRTWRKSKGSVVPRPTRPPASYSEDCPTSAVLTYFARKFGVPAVSRDEAATFDWLVASRPPAALGATTKSDAGRPPSVSASAARIA